MESVEAQQFWQSMTEGTTAQIFVELQLAKLKLIKSKVIRKTIPPLS